MKKLRNLVGLIAALGMAAFMTGCGDDDNNDTTTGGTPGGTAPQFAPADLDGRHRDARRAQSALARVRLERSDVARRCPPAPRKQSADFFSLGARAYSANRSRGPGRTQGPDRRYPV